VEVARQNAKRLGLDVECLVGDLIEPLRPRAPFDLVVANLPYVPTGVLASLPAEVRREPRVALDGGADGLDGLRRMITASSAVLAPGGALVLEIGAEQVAAAAALLAASEYRDVRLDRDLAGRDRVASGRTTSPSQ
jgi:release factor glutamine methyltransferase